MTKEIIYIHTATGYLASHFFNTQEAYFVYDDAEGNNEVEIDPDVSFREGLAPNGTTTYTPRTLIFDYKSSFGSLSHITALNSISEGAKSETSDLTWSGNITEYRQENIPQSSYHARLEIEERQDNTTQKQGGISSKEDLSSSVRFWSDFSRVFFHPRSLLRMWDPPEWETSVSWSRGLERFNEIQADHMVLDDAFRLFVEECDHLQGLQLSLDAFKLGSFTIKFLTDLRDEYAKLPILTFCSLSPFDPSKVEIEESRASVPTLNDALTLHELAHLTSQTIPLQHPSMWQHGPWFGKTLGNFTKQYHSAALLSPHIESVTLPLRLKPTIPSSTDLADLCAQLNWRGDTPFSSLHGAFPLPMSPGHIPQYVFNFSHPTSLHKRRMNENPFAQRDVFRGLNYSERVPIEKWFAETYPQLSPPFHTLSFIDQPYPIPTSYPQFFTNVDRIGRPANSVDAVRVKSVPIYSSLRTTPGTSDLAKAYAKLAKAITSRKPSVLADLGVEMDTVKEVAEDWWRWVGAYDGDEGEHEEDYDD